MKTKIKKGDMYCVVCGEVNKSGTPYCSKHGRSVHRIKGREGVFVMGRIIKYQKESKSE